jgi:hypothetical protein
MHPIQETSKGEEHHLLIWMERWLGWAVWWLQREIVMEISIRISRCTRIRSCWPRVQWAISFRCRRIKWIHRDSILLNRAIFLIIIKTNSTTKWEVKWDTSKTCQRCWIRTCILIHNIKWISNHRTKYHQISSSNQRLILLLPLNLSSYNKTLTPSKTTSPTTAETSHLCCKWNYSSNPKALQWSKVLSANNSNSIHFATLLIYSNNNIHQTTKVMNQTTPTNRANMIKQQILAFQTLTTCNSDMIKIITCHWLKKKTLRRASHHASQIQ